MTKPIHEGLISPDATDVAASPMHPARKSKEMLMAFRPGEIAGVESALVERDREIASLRQAIALQDKRISEILASNSWRFTWPYRWAGGMLKKMAGGLDARRRQLADRLRQQLVVGRITLATLRMLGAKGIWRRVSAIYASEGMAGLRRRFGRHARRFADPEAFSARTEISYDHVAFAIERQKHGNRPSWADLGRLRRRNDARLFSGLGGNPLISILVPVYDAPADFLAAAIESVLAQHYRNWELILVDDCSTSPATGAVLARYDKKDARIVVLRRQSNGNISAASNDALEIARGEFVALLDHDDVLEDNALLEVARVVKLWPEVDFIYSDEDKLARDGSFHSAYYKPDWSPSLLLSTMYTSHLSVYRSALVRRAGAFRSRYDGTQDYDLALRVAELTDRVCHIPMILYHWREGPNSSAESLENKGFAVQLQREALQDALSRRRTKGEVMPLRYPGNWRVRFALPQRPLVSIVIPSAARVTMIRGREVNLALNCIDSIASRTSYADYEIVLVHNPDIDPGVRHALGKRGKVRLLAYSAPELNLADKINLGAVAALGEYLLILNDDIEVITGDWLETLLGAFAEADVGVAGAKLFYEDGRVQHAGIVWTDSGPTHAFVGCGRHDPGAHLMGCLRRDVLGVTGACMMVPRRVFFEVNGYDPQFPLNYNDVDFCLRVREKGYRIVIDPSAQLNHFEAVSKSGTHQSELDRLMQRWGRGDDPFYNYNYDRSNPFFTGGPRRLAYPANYEDALEASVLRGRHGDGAPHGRVPKFSLLTPVFNTDARFIEELAETVFAQTCRDFEWILLDNGSTAPATTAALAQVAVGDRRVRLVRVERNLGIIGGMRQALEMASGDYVLPLDSDDLLTCDALGIFSSFIRQHPKATAFYSDEDKCDVAGRRYAPFLKPDFDSVYFTNCCYIAHLCCMERATAMALGTYGESSANGCHDWDTFYRFIHAGHIPLHVPAVTYSWRVHRGSTAGGDAGAKPFTVESQRQVMERHFAWCGKGDTHFPRFDASLGTWHIFSSSIEQVAIALLEYCGETWSASCYLYKAGMPLGNCSSVSGLSLRQAIEKAVAESKYVFYKGPGVAPGNEWVKESIAILDFFDEAAIIGGRIVANGRIVCAGLYAEYRGGAESPFAGLEAADQGYYGLLTALHRVDAVSSLLWAAKSSAMRKALGTIGEGLEDIESFLAALYRSVHAAGATVLYSPRIVADLQAGGRAKPPGPVPLPAFSDSAKPKFYSRNFSPTDPFRPVGL